MERVHTYNPFTKREFRDQRSLLIYKTLNALSWLLVVGFSLLYHYIAPSDGRYLGRTIWEQDKAHPTLFSLSPTIVDIYWIVLLVLQLCYVWHLFVAGEDLIVAALNVGSHFIFNNALQFAFIMLWVRSHFWIAEFVLVINPCNLKVLYLRYSMTASFIHIPVVSGSWAWTFIALLWNGAVMVDSHTFAAKILAHIAIWLILPFGLFYLGTFGDYTLGLELTVLSAALGAQQYRLHAYGLQWLFAIVIAAILFSATVPVALPFLLRRYATIRTSAGGCVEDLEQRPLLDHE